MHSTSTMSRRRLLGLAATAAGATLAAAAFPRRACADELPRLAEGDPTAVALGYREDATKVDATRYPTHKTGQSCANCRFFGGADKAAAGNCQLFPGKAVTARGWCSAYNAKA